MEVCEKAGSTVPRLFNQRALLPPLSNVLRGQHDTGFHVEKTWDGQYVLESLQRTLLSGQSVLDSLHSMMIVKTSDNNRNEIGAAGWKIRWRQGRHVETTG